MTRTLLVLGLVAATVSSCGSSDSGTAAPASTTIAVATTVAPAASSEPTVAPTLASELRVQELPVSVLAPIPGLTYSKIKGSPDVVPEVAAQPEIWEGTITRQMKMQSALAGTVQVLRVRNAPTTDTADETEKAEKDAAVQQLISDFAQTKKLTEVKISGQDVVIAEQVRDTGGSAACWLDGSDFILLFARQGLSVKKLATAYIAGA
jgi:hypothetical protein